MDNEKMAKVYLVWATAGSTRTVLHAFSEHRDAEMFVKRAHRVPVDDDGNEMASAADLLDVHLSIEAMQLRVL